MLIYRLDSAESPSQFALWAKESFYLVFYFYYF